jgi:hypothetical protein
MSLKDDTNKIYLLGAGFTRAVVGEKALLTHEIMSTLDISKFPEIHEYYEKAFPDIEQFLSILDLQVLHFRQINQSFSDHLNNIRRSIVQQIINRVDINVLNIKNLKNYTLLKKFISTIPKNSHILSLNYDCILDQGLYLAGRWSPFGGYCYPTFPHSRNENDSKDRILLLKLHGSCNFRDAEEGQEYFNIEINNGIFPRIHVDLNTRNSVFNDKSHILVMSYIKQFHNGIMLLWRRAISALRNAEKLVIIGCSLREEDSFLRFALYHFGMKENTEKFFIEIIDKGEDNCKKIKEKVMRLVAYPDKQKVNLFNKGLEGYLKRHTNTIQRTANSRR